MTEDQWTPGAHIVDIDIAVDIIDAGSSRTLDEGRWQIDRFKGPHRTVDPTRNEPLRLLKERCGLASTLDRHRRIPSGYVR